MYPGFVLIRYAEVTSAFERRVYCLHFPREGGLTHHAGPRGEAPKSVGQEAEREKEKVWPETLLWFLREGMGEAGLASLNKRRIESFE